MYIVGAGQEIDTNVWILRDVLLCLMYSDFAWDLSYPKNYQRLGFLQQTVTIVLNVAKLHEMLQTPWWHTLIPDIYIHFEEYVQQNISANIPGQLKLHYCDCYILLPVHIPTFFTVMLTKSDFVASRNALLICSL